LARCARRWPRNRHWQRLTEGVSCWDVLKAMNPLSWKKWKRNSKMIQTYSNSSSASHLSHDCDYGLLYLVYASTIMIHDHDSWSWFMIMINHVHFIHANNIKQPNLWHLTARHSPTKAWWRWGGGWSCWTLRGQYNTTWTQPRERQMRRDLRKQNQVARMAGTKFGTMTMDIPKRMLNVYHFFHCNWCTCMQLCMSELLTCRKWCKGGGNSDTPE
jgi:hypothetical protein